MPKDKELEQAKFHLKKNNSEIAISILLQTIALKKAKSAHFEILGYVYGNLGDKKKCLHYLSMACEFSNATPEAHFYLGKELIQMDEYQSGIQHLHKSLSKAGNFFEALFELGIGYQKLKKFSESLRFFKESAKVNPNSLEAIFNIGRLYSEELNQPQKGLQFYDQLLAIEPRNYEGWIARGNAYSLLGDYTQALLCYSKSVEINPQSAIGWNHYGLSLVNSKSFEQAYTAFENAYKLEPLNPVYIANLASVNLNNNDYQNAYHLFKKALQIKNNHTEALIGKARCEFKENKISEAFLSIDAAITSDPNRADGYFWKGCFYSDLKKFSLAIDSFETGKKYKHDHLPLLGFLLEAKMKVLDWKNIYPLFEEVSRRVLNETYTVQPLIFQAINTDPIPNLLCSKAFSKQFYTKFTENIEFKENKKKIRIAYLSPDFRNHPVYHLTHDIYRLHNRAKFEVFGYNLHFQSDEFTKKISKNFDQIYHVGHLSDFDLIQLLRSHSIDIAVDLAGHTQNARTNIFFNRFAQVQINFIGFPGTLGSPQHDFIIGDQIVSPSHEQSFFSERIINLPRVFQPNSFRQCSERFKSKTDLNLPNNTFVFCSFNSNYKISSDIFATWIEILRQTKNSVLWLFISNSEVKDNVFKYLERGGISKERIIFASFIDYADHLSRLKFANLFLDTTPFNAGTTCSDALWSKVPVLTVTGKSYCGRMSESLLRYLGMDELVVKTLDEYKLKAVELCNDQSLYSTLKFKLSDALVHTDLFSPKKYVDDLENAYEHMLKTKFTQIR
jgi:predicted O-linked N-acetylglucosamine transferase (SPINDLY family)